MGMSQSSSKSRTSLSEINVTPLVDVMLVLLIIFMVTAPMMQQGLDINLPKTKSSGIQTNDEPFVITIKENKKVYFGETQVSIDVMSEKLKSIFKTRKNKQVYLKADQKVDYGFVAEALAEIRSADIYNIGLVTLPK